MEIISTSTSTRSGQPEEVRLTSHELSMLHQQSIDDFVVHGGKLRSDESIHIDNFHSKHNTMATFVRNPVFVSHPLYPLIESSSSIASIAQMISTVCVEKLSKHPIKLTGGAVYSSRDNDYGLNAIQFDWKGSLFATGGSKGLLRVFDFDECQFSIGRRHAELHPIVSLDTKRDISCIAWSHHNEDDIAVAFTHRPEIHIYDLSSLLNDKDDDDDGTTTNTGHRHSSAHAFHGSSSGSSSHRDGCCKKVLNIMASRERSGHNVVIYWPTGSRTASNHTSTGRQQHPASSTHCNADDTSSSSSASSSSSMRMKMGGEDHVVAGSSNGYIRYWNTNRCRNSTNSNKDYCWSVIADPLRSHATASPVVSLLPLSNKYLPRSSTTTSGDKGSGSLLRLLLLSATSQGVVVLWDLSNMRPNSFGSTTLTPTSLIRMDYTTQLMLYEVPCRLIGITHSSHHHHHHHNNNLNHSSSSSISSSSSQLIMTLSNGVIHLVDLTNPTSTSNTSSNIIKNTSIYSTHDDDDDRSSTCNPSSNRSSNEQRGKSHAAAKGGPNEPLVFSYEDIQHQQAIAAGAMQQPQRTVSDLSCPAVVASWSGGTPIVSITRGGTSYMDVYGIPMMMIDDGDDIVRNSFPHVFTMNGRQPITGKVIDAQTGIMRSNMRRFERMSCTLPGHLMTAHPGSCEVIVSHDLQSYLTIESAAQSTISKSHEIQFDWTPINPLSSSSSSSSSTSSKTIHTIDHRGVPTTNTTSSIAAVTLIGYNSTSRGHGSSGSGGGGHRIVLDRPYTGPIVHQGHPRVRLRTNLIPCGRSANVNAHVHVNDNRVVVDNSLNHRRRRTITTTTTTTTSMDGWPVVRRDMSGDLPAGDQVTALAAHPHCPVLIAGLRSEGVIVICPYDNAPLEDDQLMVAVEEEVGSTSTAATPAAATTSVVSNHRPSSISSSSSHSMSGHPIISDMVERTHQSSSSLSSSLSSTISGAASSTTSKRTASDSPPHNHGHDGDELSKKQKQQRQSHNDIDFIIPTQQLQMETKHATAAAATSSHQHHLSHHLSQHQHVDRGRQGLASLMSDVSSGCAIDDDDDDDDVKLLMGEHRSGPTIQRRQQDTGSNSSAAALSISAAASLSYSSSSSNSSSSSSSSTTTTTTVTPRETMRPLQDTPMPPAGITSMSNRPLPVDKSQSSNSSRSSSCRSSSTGSSSNTSSSKSNAPRPPPPPLLLLKSRSSMGPPSSSSLSSSSSSFTVHTVTATGVARSNLEKKLLSKSSSSSSSSSSILHDLPVPFSSNKYLQILQPSNNTTTTTINTSSSSNYLSRGATDRSISSCSSNSSSSSRVDKENVPSTTTATTTTTAHPIIHGIPQQLKGDSTVKVKVKMKPLKPTAITSFFGTTTTTTASSSSSK